MATWRDVEALAEQLPRATRGEAHEGSPAYDVGRHHFARLRHDDEGRELLQTWTGDLETEAALADRRDVFPVVHTFRMRVSTWAVLDRLDLTEMAELVLDSYLVRGPVSGRGDDVTHLLPPRRPAR